MGSTPIFETLCEEDRLVVDHYVGAQSNRASQLEMSDQDPKFCYEALLETASATLLKNGHAATHMRNEYAAAYPLRIPEEIEKPWER